MELITFEESNEIRKITSLRNSPDLAENEMQSSLNAHQKLTSSEGLTRAQTMSRKHANASDKYPEGERMYLSTEKHLSSQEYVEVKCRSQTNVKTNKKTSYIKQASSIAELIK